MSYVIKPLSYILVKEGEKSFSEGQTEISVGDDGAGAYIVIIQDCEKVRIDFDEFELVKEVVDVLKKEWSIE